MGGAIDPAVRVERAERAERGVFVPERPLPAHSESRTGRTGRSGGRRAEAQRRSHSWIRSASTSSLLRFRKGGGTPVAPHGPSALGNQTPSDSSGGHNGSPALFAVQHDHSPIRQPPRSESTSRNYRRPGLSQRNSEDFLVDILPSFEMYNTLHRHIPKGNVDPDILDFPPDYQESVAVVGSDNITRSPALGVNGHSLESINTALNTLHPLATQHRSIHNSHGSSSSLASQIHDVTIQDDIDESDNIFVDKLYTLPKMATPVEINIRVTKNPPLPHQKPEEESILKEYTSGDIINGYCTIENRSSHPLKFEMFYVTLEAYASIVDKQKGKRTLKRFLRMVDLSASWSYSTIEVGTGVEVVAGDVDFDNAVFGLNNSRILEPNTKYKKFFMFKLPTQLLDVTCKQEHYCHCLLPPSFGIDKYRSNCKYSSIKVNNVLGCGHLGTKGSPILTSDLSDDNICISYTIDARIVGKDEKTQKLNIMKEREYNLRVIPFGFSTTQIGERDSLSQLNDLTRLIQERLDVLKLVMSKLETQEPIKNTDIHGTDLSGTVEDNAELDSEEILRRKMDQLHIRNRLDPANMTAVDGMGPFQDEKIARPKQENIVESDLSYKMKGKSRSSSNLKKNFFAGLYGNGSGSNPSTASSQSKLESSADRVGMIIARASTPQQALNYWCPSLLRKSNKFEAKNKHDQDNWLRLMDTLPELEKYPMQHLDLTLTCIQPNNTIHHTPPEIHSVTTDLICITGRSDNSIPIKLDTQLLTNSERLKSIKNTYTEFLNKIKDYEKKFHEARDDLNALYNYNVEISRARELKFTDFVSPQMLSDVESLSNLDVSISVLSDTFRKQMHTLKDTSDSLSANPSTSNSSHSMSRNNSSGVLNPTFSNSSNSGKTKTTNAAKFANQIVHEWIEVAPKHYERNINVNLEYNYDSKETLIPSFESCLCCRFYCVRVTIKFEHHIGSLSIDIPVNVRKLSD